MPVRTLRTALAASLVLSLSAAGGALAGPKPSCNLVTDDEQDTFLVRLQDAPGAYGPQEDTADILSADVATDEKTITGVVRVKSLAAAPSTSPGGISYDINFTTDGIDSPLYIRAVVPRSGEPTAEAGSRESFVITSISAPLGEGTVVVDAENSEVRFSFPLAYFDELGGLKAGAKLAFGDITTGRALNSSRAVFADAASTDKTYTVGAPSCVKPGE